MTTLNEAAEAFLDLEYELGVARIEGSEDFEVRFADASRWFAAGQPVVFRSDAFSGRLEKALKRIGRRKLYQLTEHAHPSYGDTRIAHVSVPRAKSHQYESRIAFAEVDGSPRVVGIYTRCGYCAGEGCSNEDPDDGNCQNTGWLHAPGVVAPDTYGPSTSKTDLAEPVGNWSTEMLANN